MPYDNMKAIYLNIGRFVWVCMCVCVCECVCVCDYQ